MGAGSAGCVLAARLSEDLGNRVALLEAGGRDSGLRITMPAGVLAIRRDRRFDWHYRSQPIPGCNGRTIEWPRGKVLGGSSSINGMLYVRGSRHDYDDWSEMGLGGWSFDRCLPYFRRAENNESKRNDIHHSQSGPLVISDAIGGTPVYEAFVKAGEQAGYPRTDDFNGAHQEGIGFFQFTIGGGERCSTARAYLHPAAHRSNLAVIIHAHATRVVLEGYRAIGVEYSQVGVRKIARARKEVILSGGAINSPQILMLSGIGPPAELRRHGIDVVCDLPGVGENLQDHFDYLVEHECTTGETFDVYTTSPLLKAWVGLRYLLWRTGPATGLPVDVGGFLKTCPGLKAPDIELQLLGALSRDDVPGSGFKVHVTNLHPQSRGRIGLSSDDPLGAPSISPNFLDTETDRTTIRKGVRIARNILSQPALDPYRGREIQPGSDVVSDADLDDEIAACGEMDHHAVGTCAMGTVVDEVCRVR